MAERASDMMNHGYGGMGGWMGGWRGGGGMWLWTVIGVLVVILLAALIVKVSQK